MIGRLAGGVAVLLSMATTTQAQTLPAEVLEVLAAECDARPGPMPDRAAFGDLLNAVAWRTRHLGIGLSRKTSGMRVPSPAGEIAEDVLCDRATGHHWDVIAGAGVGLALSCGGGPSIGVMRDSSRPCVAPVAPVGLSAPDGLPAPPASVTQGPSVPTPVPAPVVVPDYRPQLAELTAQVLALRGEVEAMRVTAQAHKDALYALIAEVLVAEHLDDIKRRIDALQSVPAPAPARPRWPW
jgi:hypothetical protein